MLEERNFKIKENVRATIKEGTAPASLTAKNSPTTGTSRDGSSGIAVEGNLTIESGTIEATADGEKIALHSQGHCCGKQWNFKY